MSTYRADARQLAAAYWSGASGQPIDVTLVEPVAEKAELVEIVKRKTSPYGDGEYLQGDSEISAVYRVGKRYFRQFGYLGSYDDEPTFDGRIEEVEPIETRTTNYRKKA